MKLSIRAKILGGYSVVIILFLAVMLNSIFTQRTISQKLRIINEDYLPKLKMVTNLSNYNHLDISFDVKKIIANRNNSLFIQSVKLYHPRLLENQLGQITKSIEESEKRVESTFQKRLLMLILQSIEAVKEKHSEYKKEIKKVLKTLDSKGEKAALALNAQLKRKKRELTSEISFLRKRLDNNIRSSLGRISRMEKKASIITTVLSLLAVVIAGIITLFALFTLAPIRKLIAGVKKISEGDYNHRVDIKTEGEVKTLADEFNNMSESILERNNALKEQQKKLIQSERMAVIGRMASHITHEVKNPLNSMSLNTDLLEDELNGLKDKGETKEAFSILASIKKEIERLSKLSEEYLSYARMPKREKQSADINTIIKDLISLIKGELDNSNISLNEELTPDIPNVSIDINQIRQAFLNIVKNAIEALTEGGKVEILTHTDGRNISITFKDNGPGITQESLDHIFDPFFSTKEKGTGLGLSLTQKIIREQGGEIKCESEANQGTKFTITLPCADEGMSIGIQP